MQDNRRVHARIRLSVPVEYKDFERFHPDRIINLSATGAFIFTPKPLFPNQEVAIRFTLEELPEYPCLVLAKVVWVPPFPSRWRPDLIKHPMGMGVQFDPKNIEILRFIDQYITVKNELQTLDTRIGIAS